MNKEPESMMSLKEKAERLKYMFDALNKQKKKYERLRVGRGLSKPEYEQYVEVMTKLENFNEKCKNFIRPRKNGAGKFSVEDYLSWSREQMVSMGKSGVGARSPAEIAREYRESTLSNLEMDAIAFRLSEGRKQSPELPRNGSDESSYMGTDSPQYKNSSPVADGVSSGATMLAEDEALAERARSGDWTERAQAGHYLGDHRHSFNRDGDTSPRTQRQRTDETGQAYSPYQEGSAWNRPDETGRRVQGAGSFYYGPKGAARDSEMYFTHPGGPAALDAQYYDDRRHSLEEGSTRPFTGVAWTDDADPRGFTSQRFGGAYAGRPYIAPGASENEYFAQRSPASTHASSYASPAPRAIAPSPRGYYPPTPRMHESQTSSNADSGQYSDGAHANYAGTPRPAAPRSPRSPGHANIHGPVGGARPAPFYSGRPAMEQNSPFYPPGPTGHAQGFSREPSPYFQRSDAPFCVSDPLKSPGFGAGVQPYGGASTPGSFYNQYAFASPQFPKGPGHAYARGYGAPPEHLLPSRGYCSSPQLCNQALSPAQAGGPMTSPISPRDLSARAQAAAAHQRQYGASHVPESPSFSPAYGNSSGHTYGSVDPHFSFPHDPAVAGSASLMRDELAYGANNARIDARPAKQNQKSAIQGGQTSAPARRTAKAPQQSKAAAGGSRPTHKSSVPGRDGSSLFAAPASTAAGPAYPYGPAAPGNIQSEEPSARRVDCRLRMEQLDGLVRNNVFSYVDRATSVQSPDSPLQKRRRKNTGLIVPDSPSTGAAFSEHTSPLSPQLAMRGWGAPPASSHGFGSAFEFRSDVQPVPEDPVRSLAIKNDAKPRGDRPQRGASAYKYSTVGKSGIERPRLQSLLGSSSACLSAEMSDYVLICLDALMHEALTAACSMAVADKSSSLSFGHIKASLEKAKAESRLSTGKECRASAMGRSEIL
ncbi:hypothetical protein PAPHI01_0209 [Pancytospora philotis]|nr:hypothetical protein PAPHI01_0209 [Pancytospora philotis]